MWSYSLRSRFRVEWFRPVLQRRHYKQFGVLAWLFCATLGSAQAADSMSLFQRLGGAAVLKPVVQRLLARAHSEPVTKRSFRDTNLERIEEKLYEQICAISDGPCTYTGDDMKLVHGGLSISHAEFYGLVQQLREELDRAGVSAGAKNELLKRLAPMQADIVTQP